VGQLPITVRGDTGEGPIHLGLTLLMRPDIPFVHFGLGFHQHQGAVLECFGLLRVFQCVEVMLLVLLYFRDGICDAPGLLLEALHVVTLFMINLRAVLGEVQV